MRLTETVLKPWRVAIFVAGRPATVAGRPATSPATPRQSEVDGSVARVGPARTCPSEKGTWLVGAMRSHAAMLMQSQWRPAGIVVVAGQLAGLRPTAMPRPSTIRWTAAAGNVRDLDGFCRR